MLDKLFLIMFILIFSFKSISDEIDSKERILIKIENLINQEKQELQLLKEATNSKKQLKLTIDPQKIIQNSNNQIRILKFFYNIVKEKNSSALVELLVQTFRSCNDKGNCQNELVTHQLQEIITVAGASVLNNLFMLWKELPEFQREILLKLSINTRPLICRENVLAQALTDSSTRVRSFSLNVSKLSCTEETFKKHVSFLLKHEKDENVLLYVFDFIQGDGLWFEQVVQAIQEGRVKIESAQSQICSTSARAGSIEKNEKIDVAFWLLAFLKNSPLRSSCIAEAIFLKLRSRTQFLKMHRIFQDAVESRFLFQSTTVLNATTRRSPKGDYWIEIPGKDQAMLDQFQKSLIPEDFKKWRESKEILLGEKLILTKWLNEDPIILLPKTVKLRIQVFSDKKKLVSDSAHEVVRDQPFTILGVTTNKSFRGIGYQGILRFDPKNLIYKIDPLLVELKPAGAAFEVSIPVNGFFEAALMEFGQKFIWQISVR